MALDVAKHFGISGIDGKVALTDVLHETQHKSKSLEH